MELREVTYTAILLRIAAAFLLGGLLGFERGFKQRPAGLRTYMLVSVGACMIMLTNQYIYQMFNAGDPVRMGAQVVSGIGFLGAGTIVVTKHRQIKGLTTAAGLWAAAAVGLAVGIGLYEVAVVGATVIFITLTLIGYLDNRMHRKTRWFDIYVELPQTVSLGTLINILREKDISVEDVRMESGIGLESGVRSFMLTLNTKKRLDRTEVITVIHEATNISRVEVF